MGLLNKWTKKKEKEQLEAADRNESDIDVAEVKESEKSEKAAEAPAKKAPAKKAKVVSLSKDVLVRPYVSEKAVMSEAKGVYTFVVTKDATKIDVKKAVKAQYGVLPKTVRMMNMDGKKVRFGRFYGRRSDWKKAVVTVPKGQSISIHEGV